MPIQSKNPATGEIIKNFNTLDAGALEAKLAKAQEAYLVWKEKSFQERADLMEKHAKYLRDNKGSLARIATLEMGKTITAGLLEIEKCANVCEYYAKHAEQILADEKLDGGARENYVAFEPLGVVLAVMPWNFPYWQVYRFLAPALMAGNVGLLKHASNVPQCALAIEQGLLDSGFPIGVFQSLLVESTTVDSIIRDSRVVAVTLTGSEKAGASVASIAGSEIKKTVLELGGSDPFIVFGDADLAVASQEAASGRMQNNAGQSCIAAKRFIVHESVAPEFAKLLADRFAKLVVGDPSAPETQMGPLANEAGLLEVERQVAQSVAQGAQILFGGHRLDGAGYYYLPTVLVGVQKGMPVYDEEVFGPIAPIITFKDTDEAIRIANDTPYGLGASIFTRDTKMAKKIAQRIESGNVFINGFVRSDPRLPFGGIKKSGYGRELSHYGIKEFVNIKNIWIG